MRKLLLTTVLLLVALCAVTACGGGETAAPKTAAAKVREHAERRQPYIPKNDVEFDNYNQAQRLYDSPDTIIWCSTTWGNPSAPIVTVPVAGKLTSSSTTYFQPEESLRDDYAGDGHGLEPTGGVVSSRSVDGMFHPNPPKYRYGFTPGGQYVDFSEMPTFCTTALTKFQRQSTEVSLSVDGAVAAAQEQAEQALARGDRRGAQRILTEAIDGS